MPHISQRYTDLAERGPDVHLTLARPLAVKLPPGMECRDQAPDVRGLIDTGATWCGIRATLADDLGLQPINLREVGNSMGKSMCEIYTVDLIFPDDGDRRWSYEAARCTFGDPNIEFVLGRNFLEHAEFTYDGPKGHYKLDLVVGEGSA